MFGPAGFGERGPFDESKFHPLRSMLEQSRYMEFTTAGIAMDLDVPTFPEPGIKMDKKFRTAALIAELVEGTGRKELKGQLFDGIG